MKEYSITEIHRLMEQGGLTAVALVQEFLDRIDAVDRTGPAINSVIEVNPDALAIAEELDRYFVDNGKKGLLHGIPILLKDNIDTADKMATTAGSLAIEKYGGQVKEDAHVVKRLRDAGAIILGKTNLSEMANFRGSRSTSGWSSRGGLTKNPYALNRNTSGSSSGSGAAVAANLCTVAIGTETDGSVISPSNNNGIVGIKPSIGLVSRAGIIPIASSQDTAGPMTRSVRDAAILLDVMVGHDPTDTVT
ncbi:MAG: amidase family protein, partial [Candidatus Kariarchaeaceae archaeon]